MGTSSINKDLNNSKEEINSNSNSKSNESIYTVNDALDQAIEIAKTESDNKERAISKLFEDNNGEKSYNEDLANLLGKNKSNEDLTNLNNLDKYVESRLYVNSRDEATDLYKKSNREENRTPIIIFNPSNIANISLHPEKYSQFSYTDFKEYNEQYVRLEDCTYDCLFGSGSNGHDALYSVFLNAYYPSNKNLTKNLNIKLSMDYTDVTTSNHRFSKDEKFTIEGKISISEGGDTFILNKCRVVEQ